MIDHIERDVSCAFETMLRSSVTFEQTALAKRAGFSVEMRYLRRQYINACVYTQTGTTMQERSTNSQERLERVQVMLHPADREFLDQLTGGIHERTGVHVSRSEIIRAGLAVLRELHRSGPIPLTGCESGSDLAVAGMACIRLAAEAERLHT